MGEDSEDAAVFEEPPSGDVSVRIPASSSSASYSYSPPSPAAAAVAAAGWMDGWMVDAPLGHAVSSGEIRIGQGWNRAFARFALSPSLSHPVSPHATLHILARTQRTDGHTRTRTHTHAWHQRHKHNVVHYRRTSGVQEAQVLGWSCDLQQDNVL